MLVDVSMGEFRQKLLDSVHIRDVTNTQYTETYAPVNMVWWLQIFGDPSPFEHLKWLVASIARASNVKMHNYSTNAHDVEKFNF